MRKSADDLAKMRKAGRVVAEMHARIRDAVRPGVTTAALDRVGRSVIEAAGARSNFLGYHGFPAVICTSPNDVIVHGIPSESVVLDEGDIISIDCGAIVQGWHGDAAFTMGVGTISAEAEKLLRVGEESLWAGIRAMVDGGRLSDIGHAVQTVAEGAGFSVVREYVGHGIGTAMHERPDVPNHGEPGRGPKLRPGITLAVEPMVNVGSPGTVLLDDGWTVVTADGSLSAHFEHTICVTEDGPEVFTVL
jgi:methionyl aminopeptidase